jgi:hypothetical protein
MTAFFTALVHGPVTTTDALTIFDELEPVPLEFMVGSWQGAGFPTRHPLDGLLETYHWHGKRFESPEDVHPLVFQRASGQLTSVDPVWVSPIFSLLRTGHMPQSRFLSHLFQRTLPLFATHRPCARLRMTEFRGHVSATMVYDNLPINDVFRRVNDETLLGLMDLRGMARPFFFMLRRESGPGL